MPNSADHPLVSRFSGSLLVGYQQRDFDEAHWPADPTLLKGNPRDQFMNVARVEGKVTRIVYVSPKGKSPLEVYRNYEQALTAAGFQRIWACERDCKPTFWAWHDQFKITEGIRWSTDGLISSSGGRYMAASAVTSDESRLWVGKLTRGDGSTVMVQFITSVAVNATTDWAGTWVQMVEPKPMQTGQVTVDVKALQTGLVADGKISLYGLFFDNGKAEIKPESTAQLNEMSKLMQAQPQFKVFIVGHTDNVGDYEANQSLSLKRAEAVVKALAATPYRIDAKRMLAKGAANIAPLSSNAGEAGRARNRRVELVLQ